jgi:serine/threonine protein kinase
MALSNGTRLGPYEILDAIGAGGMGEVYRARDTRLERIVAIKTLPAHLSCGPIRKQRFEREAKTISGLNHPRICVLYDVGSHDGVDYLVMECVEGETLAKRLEKGALPFEQVLKYGTQIADALDLVRKSSTEEMRVSRYESRKRRPLALLLTTGISWVSINPLQQQNPRGVG